MLSVDVTVWWMRQFLKIVVSDTKAEKRTGLAIISNEHSDLEEEIIRLWETLG